MALRLPTANAPSAMKQIRLADVVVGLIGLAAAAASIWAVPGVSGFLGVGLALLMLAIAAVDYRYFIIPNELTAAALALALVNAVFAAAPSLVENVAGAAPSRCCFS